MKDKYKYLKNLNNEFLELLLNNSDLDEREYKVLKSSLQKDDFREKTCKELYISKTTYQNIKENALSKVHLMFCMIMRKAFKN